MSIAFSTKDAIILDHERWILKLYENSFSQCHDPNDKLNLKNFQQLFDLRTPFMMDGRAEKVAKHMEDGSESSQPPKKKKKKNGEIIGNEPSKELEHVRQVFTALRIVPEFREIFSYVPSAEDYRNNNKCIRNLRNIFTELSSTPMPIQCKGSTRNNYQTIDLGNNFLLPPNVTYICDDVRNITQLSPDSKYDLVVMDPPWWNRYIRRRCIAQGAHHGYDMMSVPDIIKLPIGDILNDDALVAIWCTNNDNQLKEFTAGLINWGVEVVATWYWLKVTRGGEPISPLTNEGHGKRPYERILFARKLTKERSGCVVIPNGLVLCSIPSGIHSHKPPLSEVLLDYIDSSAKCLEIFARSLTPGWTSFGLEVLKLQHSFLYK